MREGFYRLRYETGGFRNEGVITLHAGVWTGCDRFYFMHGRYEKDDNQLNGFFAFKRHTSRPNQNPAVPEEFAVRLWGICGSNFGQCDFQCPDIPALKGHATFSWLGGYMS